MGIFFFFFKGKGIMIFWAEHSAFVDDEKQGVKWLFLLSRWLLYLSLTCAVSLIKIRSLKKTSQHLEANIIISLILCLLSRLLCLLLSEDNCRHVPFELLLAASTLFFFPPFPFLDFLPITLAESQWVSRSASVSGSRTVYRQHGC